MGYSDTTVTHFMCLQAGLSSFYGPAVMNAFAENVAMHDYTIHGIRKTLFTNEEIGKISNNNEGWSTQFLDWADKNNQNIKRTLNPPTGWNFIGEKKIACRGRLIGGCLESIQLLNNTELWPNFPIWDQAIFFLETSEEGMEPAVVTRFMRNLAAQGILSCLGGILFSKPGGQHMTAACFSKYDQALLKVFEEYEIPLIPIVTCMDFGHSDPMWVMPFGAMVEINPNDKTVTILENGVE
jgi:muramoyltetrapeptide carboxypeptidase LdcA involved in peptidoglycan recycling